MLRKLAVTIAMAGGMSGLVVTSTAHGLGLGEISLGSALNQPLKADIILVDLQGLTAPEIHPKLATREDFERAGVERPGALSQLRFKTLSRSDGTLFVRVSTPQAISEPFLNFLVEVHWPKGRLLREYVVLLDPPSLNRDLANSSVTSQPAVLTSKKQATQLSRPQATAPPLDSTPAPIEQDSQAAAHGTYHVKKNDTLWDIALHVRPNRNVSPAQMMAALQEENPSAFINGNINLLKAGTQLKIPDNIAIKAIDPTAARKSVSWQNKQWQQGRVQVDATKKTQVRESARGTAEDDRLSIVSGAKENVGSGADQGEGQQIAGSVRELEQALSLSQEQLDTLNRENSDLRDRLKDLKGQIDTLERLIALKNNQLAAAQALAQSETSAVNGEKSSTPKDPNLQKEIDYNFSDGAQETQPPKVTADDQLAEEPEQGTAPSPPTPEATLSNRLIGSLPYLGGGVLTLILLTLAGRVVRRRWDSRHSDTKDIGAQDPSQNPFPDNDKHTEKPQDTSNEQFARNQQDLAPPERPPPE